MGWNGASTEWAIHPNQSMGYDNGVFGAECDVQRATGNGQRTGNGRSTSQPLCYVVLFAYIRACTSFLHAMALSLTGMSVARVASGAYPFPVAIRRLLLLLDEGQSINVIDRDHCGGSARNREANGTARRRAHACASNLSIPLAVAARGER